MTLRVFPCLDYANDFWRVRRLLDAPVLSSATVAGPFWPADWEATRSRGDDAARALIRDALSRSQVTLVFIGAETADDPWVHYAIEQSIARGNGLLGLHVHMIPDQHRAASPRGQPPSTPKVVAFPTYDWDGDVVRLQREIAAAYTRSAHREPATKP